MSALLGIILLCINSTTVSNLESLSLAEEPILWLCEAESRLRSYKVAQLDRAVAHFVLEIYNGSVFAPDHYLETIQIAVELVGKRQPMGSGQTSAGTTVRVRAFGGNIECHVEDNSWGAAAGRCERIGDLN
ncbi:MAG: hypothetical protein KME12_16345 [Trichocoleus desertorum ATA4-8-CV12]|jgi:hypothetical protein|nr:hypothetical protein [Trichocoleus desertorum ATA4-8-CV12]